MKEHGEQRMKTPRLLFLWVVVVVEVRTLENHRPRLFSLKRRGRCVCVVVAAGRGTKQQKWK
jgi:hypothetical protein